MNKRKIYYGPKGKETSMYWEVRVSRAKKPVVLNGTLMQGAAGKSVGCGISDKANGQKSAFPHPVFLISVTATGLFAVDKKDRSGHPSHAVWYSHPYSWFVLANDTKQVEKLRETNPEKFEGPFYFNAPRKIRKGAGAGGIEKPPGPRGKLKSPHVVARGCLARARTAGFVDKEAMRQLTKALVG